MNSYSKLQFFFFQIKNMSNEAEARLMKALTGIEFSQLIVIEEELRNSRQLEWVAIRATVVKVNQLRSICRRHGINWGWYCENRLPFIPRRTITWRLNVAKYLPQIDRDYGERLNARTISLTEVLREIKDKQLGKANEMYQMLSSDVANRDRMNSEVGGDEHKQDELLVDSDKMHALVTQIEQAKKENDLLKARIAELMEDNELEEFKSHLNEAVKEHVDEEKINSIIKQLAPN